MGSVWEHLLSQLSVQACRSVEGAPYLKNLLGLGEALGRLVSGKGPLVDGSGLCDPIHMHLWPQECKG